jgi:hypothetical protein
MGCWYVAGSFGQAMGQQLYDRIIRSASKKLRKRLATKRSWRKSFWKRSENKSKKCKLTARDDNLPRGKVFQAIVSVMAVKTQLSSPSIVRRSFNWPGILKIKES